MRWKYRKGAWEPWSYTTDRWMAEHKSTQGYEVVWAPFDGRIQ